MRNVWMLLLTLTVSTFFIHVSHTGQIGFLFNDSVHLSYNQYTWWICQHLQVAILAGICWDESQRWHLRSRERRVMISNIYKGYFIVILLDVFISVLFYDDPLKDYRVTWNILKTVIFIGIIVWQLKRRS